MKKITVSGVPIDVVRKNIKNINLSVSPPNGRVRISAPLRIPDDAIRLFAVSNLGWIQKNREKFKNRERTAPKEFKDTETHYFQGRRYGLRVREIARGGRVELSEKDGLTLYVKPGSSVEYRRRVFQEWRRRELKKTIPEMLAHWEKKMNVQVHFWGVKRMKTKWGSCNILRKRIWLNLELAKKPVQLLEYVLVHEMTHLLERRHNAEFKAWMDHFLPGWRTLKDALNKTPIGYED
ncbi:Metal-dependent hydrolase [Candidatus Desulfarcum epimagneticum]|uniref:Metal-dependent hydrolase n=1 Tax=uncultured Desulfobacteraceae bacterium TaxID=218296 RepID=A0A484HL76_9BACT|nr:Metal-dependent hydrolase [uncultured Desulfobacteraceae bacterium]